MLVPMAKRRHYDARGRPLNNPVQEQHLVRLASMVAIPDHLRASSADSNSRRTSIAIQDILNPSNECPLTSRSPSIDTHTDSMSRSSSFEHLSRRSSVSSSASGHTVGSASSATVPEARDSVSVQQHRLSSIRNQQRRSQPKKAVGHRALPIVNRTIINEEDVPARTRSYRAPYNFEQKMWIWFHMIDLCMKWGEANRLFQSIWPGAVREKGGIQCKFYRILDEYKLPKRRDQKFGPEGNRLRYGMWAKMRYRYPWMDQHANLLPGYGPSGPPYHMSG